MYHRLTVYLVDLFVLSSLTKTFVLYFLNKNCFLTLYMSNCGTFFVKYSFFSGKMKRVSANPDIGEARFTKTLTF